MKDFIRTLVLLIVVCLSVCAQQPQATTVILVRHAEKNIDGTKDPDLSAEGKVRAEKLLSMLKDTQVSSVYATGYKRTQQTVAPLAKVIDTDIQTYEPLKTDVIKKIIADNTGKTIVICGHSNTIPWTANILTGRNDLKDLPDTEYSTLYIITIPDGQTTGTLTRINY